MLFTYWYIACKLGMATENGPFIFETNKTNFKLNENSWNKKANVIYLESPGGVIMK